MKKIILIASLFVICSMPIRAQKIHLLNFCNTFMGPEYGISRDYERTNQEVGMIANMLNYGIQHYIGINDDCSKEKLTRYLDLLSCGSEDIIIFYYSGHGTRSNQDNSKFPQMMLKYTGYQQDKFVPVHYVAEKLKAKGARFVLILTDCCNNASQGVSAKSDLSKDAGAIVLSPKDEENCRKLFLGKKGMVIATGSRTGETSKANDRGGLFSRSFFEVALYKTLKGDSEPDWNKVLDLTYAFTSRICSTQHPYYEIHLDEAAPVPASAPAPQQQVIAPDDHFSSELSVLLNATLSTSQRLQQVDALLSRFFTSDAMVASVGRNGTTVIEYSSARDFLRRIALSNHIMQVSIINDTPDANGKRNYIKVQEIRKDK